MTNATQRGSAAKKHGVNVNETSWREIGKS